MVVVGVFPLHPRLARTIVRTVVKTVIVATLRFRQFIKKKFSRKQMARLWPSTADSSRVTLQVARNPSLRPRLLASYVGTKVMTPRIRLALKQMDRKTGTKHTRSHSIAF